MRLSTARQMAVLQGHTTPSSTAFTPLSLSPSAWYDASVASSITASGGAVSAWADLSGNSRTLSQASSANRPATGSHTMNGQNVIYFDEVSNIKFMDAASNYTSAFTAGSLFMVAKGAAGQHGSHRLGGGDDSWHTFGGDMYEWFGSNSRVGPWTPTFTITNAHTYCVIAAANDWRAYGDGTLDKTLVSNTVAFTATPSFGWNAANGFTGDIAEILIFNSALSTADRQAVQTYLKAKWGTP